MRPILFHLPDWLTGAPIPSYGVMMILGTLLGALVFAALVGHGGGPRGKAFELLLETIIVGIVSGKIAGVVISAPDRSLTWEAVVGSGGIWYVGFLCAVAWLAWRGRTLGMPVLATLDCAMPAVALGHAVGRVGCFLAGCCYGARCDLPWAVTFTDELASRSGVPLGVPLHPTQLYEAATETLLAAGLIAALVLGWPRFQGQVALLYLASYAVIRFSIEAVRADFRGAVGPLSTSQLIALAVFALSVALLVAGWRRGRFPWPGTADRRAPARRRR